MGKLQSQTPMNMFWLGLFKGTSNWAQIFFWNFSHHIHIFLILSQDILTIFWIFQPLLVYISKLERIVLASTTDMSLGYRGNRKWGELWSIIDTVYSEYAQKILGEGESGGGAHCICCIKYLRLIEARMIGRWEEAYRKCENFLTCIRWKSIKMVKNIEYHCWRISSEVNSLY